MSLLELHDVRKSFGSVEALRGVTFAVEPGEVVGLVGDNGAGKSTLMKTITGVYQPDGGAIRFNGVPLTGKHPGEIRALGIEMIYQDLALVPSLDVVSNVFLGRERVHRRLGGLIRSLDERGMEKATWEVVRRLRINMASVRTPVARLSGGQQQAVAIGRAMSFNARVIIMDEPTAALAVREVGKVLDLVRDLHHHGVSVILISHRMQDVFAVADRVMVLYGGQVMGVRRVADTTVDEVVRLIVGGDGRTP